MKERDGRVSDGDFESLRRLVVEDGNVTANDKCEADECEKRVWKGGEV